MRRGKQARKPHPDPRSEAQLQRVLSLYEAVRRTEDRIEGITRSQDSNDFERRQASPSERTSAALAQQAEELRAERASLEEFIAATHEEIFKRLLDMGDDALYLGPVP